MRHSWAPPLWYLPTCTLVHATQATKWTLPPPQSCGALLGSLQVGAAWVWWKEKGLPVPYFPMLQGQALIHTESMGAVEWGAIVPDRACQWGTATAPHPLRPPRPCHCLLRTVPSLAPRLALNREVLRALLDHRNDWMMASGTRCPPGRMLKRLTG